MTSVQALQWTRSALDDVYAITRAIAAGPSASAGAGREALSRLYEDRFPFVFRLARRMLGPDEQRCLDLVQETMMRFIRKRPICRDLRALNAWLARTAKRLALDMLRTDQRQRKRELEAQQMQLARLTHDRDQTEAKIEWLRSELTRLDDRTCALLHARFGFGLTLKQIGRHFGLSAAGTHKKIQRTLSDLQNRSQEARND